MGRKTGCKWMAGAAALLCLNGTAFAGWFTNDLTDAASVASDFSEYVSAAGNSVWSYTNDYAAAQDGSLNTELQGGAVLDFVSADDDTARSYLGTIDADWLTQSWTAHIAVETVNEDPKNTIFFGIGSGEPNVDDSNKPTTTNHVYVTWQSGTSGSKVSVIRNGETADNTGAWLSDDGYDLYMTYDHNARTIQFEIDNWNGGRYSDIDVTTDAVSIDGYLSGSDPLQLFFGGNAVMTFRDFYVKDVFECVHPGMPFTLADLEDIKANLDVEPWKTGYEDLVNDSRSSLDYEMQGPCDVVGRTSNTNLSEFKNDMQAIYNLSRMWYYTEDEDYAVKAHDMLVSWATNHTAFTGGEIYLSMGDYTYRVFGGADILRGTWDGWTDEDTEICKTYFEELYWDEDILDIPGPLRSANQGILQLIPAVGVAIFNDDETKFNTCLEIFRSDAAGGLLSSLPNGQIGDTGRDSGHAYGQLQHLAWIAEAFWKQGVDVFAEYDNRLLAAGEYFSRYNLDADTAFVQAGTVYDVYPCISSIGSPGQANSVSPDALGIIHGAYVLRKGMSAPYLEAYLDVSTQDSESFDHLKTADSSTASVPAALTAAAETASVTSLNSTDMGDASAGGSAVYEDGTWTVEGSGSALWYSSAPDYHFAYLTVTGDASIIAQLTSLDADDDDAKAGLVFSENLTDSAAMAAVVLANPDGDNAMYSFTRGDEAHSHPGNDYRQYPNQSDPKVPYWFKIERIGDRVTLFSSPDGASWSTAHCADYDIGDTAYFGLAVSSDDNGSLASAAFTDVRITGGDGGEAPELPSAPYALYASQDDSETTLRWLESFEAAGYRLYRSSAYGGPYEMIAEVSNTTYYVDEDVSSGDEWFYAVSAVNSVGESGRSAAAYSDVEPPDVYEAEDYDSQSGLKWEDCQDYWGGQNSSYGTAGDWCLYESITIGSNAVFKVRAATPQTNIAGRVEVRLGSSSGTVIGSADVSYTGGWQDWETCSAPLSVTPGTYSICLLYCDDNDTGLGTVFNLNWFDIVSVAAPTGLQASPVSLSQIDLTWNDMDGVSEYILKRATVSGGPYTELDSGPSTTFHDTGLQENTLYYYVVTAVYDDDLGSADSAEISAVTGEPVPQTVTQFFTNMLIEAESAGVDFDQYISSASNSIWSFTNGYALAEDGTTNTVLQGGAVLDYVSADDDTARSYLGTVYSNYAGSSWTAHVAIEAPSDTQPYIFFGLGDPTPNTDYYNEPSSGQGVFVRWQSGNPGSKVMVLRNGSVATNTGAWQGDPGYDIYMTYDHVEKTVQFEIDNWSGNVRDYGTDIDVDCGAVSIDGCLTDTNNVHIFFGANARVTFGDFEVEYVTPSETDNGTPTEWLEDYGLTVDDDELDTDGDGMLSWEEYIAGTDPTVQDAFGLGGFSAGGSNNLSWDAVSGRVYSVYWSSNLVDGFSLIESNAADGLYVDAERAGESAGFYKITVELEQ